MPDNKNPNTSYVRVLNASPDTPEVYLTVNGAHYEGGVKYGEFTQYSTAKPGVYEFAVFPDELTKEVRVKELIEISPNTIYTLSVTGTGTAFDIEPIGDTPHKTDAGKGAVRFVNMSNDGEEYNVNINDAPAVEDLTHYEAGDFMAILPGTYGIKLYSAEDNALLYEDSAVRFDAGKSYGGYILGSKEQPTLVFSVEGASYI
ncbi:hypothetical protein FACS189490_07230 [Clostridia bacterium]|nr:hypothetical protein FACS189490_07230 [Clostridia bacterium]